MAFSTTGAATTQVNEMRFLLCLSMLLTLANADLTAQGVAVADSSTNRFCGGVFLCPGEEPRVSIMPYSPDTTRIVSQQHSERLALAIAGNGRSAFWGVVIGGFATGTIAVVAHRVTQGPCDDGDAWIPCEVGYAMTFSIGSAPGALLGGLIGWHRP